MDHLPAESRSKHMALIKGRDTGPEMIVRRLVHSMGFRYRLHRSDLPGKPDLVFGPRRKVIFVHGCFWHQHKAENCRHSVPKSRTDYWLPKLKRNVERDQQNLNKLEKDGWQSLVIWECELRELAKVRRRILAFLE